MINHKSVQTFHDLAKTIRVSFAAGIEAENRQIALKTKKAHEHWVRMREFKEAQKNEMAR